MVDTPLHPCARKVKGRLIGEAFAKLGMDMSQLNDSFRLFSERALVAQYSMMQLNTPLALIAVTGV